MVAPTTPAPQQLSSDQFVKRARKLLDRGYFPLPVGRFDTKREQYKLPWIDGYHGFDAKRATENDIESWPAIVVQKIAEGQRGILSLGIVLPNNVLAMDVDAYKGEHVGAKLDYWATQFGPLPPTYRITARDDSSGIRLYRKPIDYYPQEIRNSGIDWIDQNHRFVMAPGSWHSHAVSKSYSLIVPETGERKVWMPPPASDLPELPESYVKGLESNPHGHRAGSLSDVRDFLDRHTSARRPGSIQGVESLWRRVIVEHGTHEALKQAADMGFNDAAAGNLDARQVYKLLGRLWKSTGRSMREFDDLICWQVIRSESLDSTVTSTKAARDYGTDTRKPMTTNSSAVSDPFDDDDDPFADDDNPLTEARAPIFTVMGPTDWAQPVEPTSFLIRQVLSSDTWGVNSGPEKSLKTHDNQAIAIAVSSGLSLYGHSDFSVKQPEQVLYIVGEGGNKQVRRVLHRMCAAYGLKLHDIQNDRSFPLEVWFGAAPLDSPLLRDELRAQLDRVQPKVVLMESFYNFHPREVSASNLYERGQVIDSYHKLIRSGGEDVVSLLTDHNKKGANELGLQNISMSGQAENSDSWIQRRHRRDPDVVNGDFWLTTSFNGRDWGGSIFDIDWHLGTFNHDLGTHDGQISWEVHRHGGTTGKAALSMDAHILTVITEKPWQLNRESLHRMNFGSRKAVVDSVKNLLQSKLISEDHVSGVRGKVFGPATGPAGGTAG